MSLQLLDRPSASSNTLASDAGNTADALDALLRETAWTSLDSTYERGLRAGRADAVREHLGVLHGTAASHVAAKPSDRAAVLAFVAELQRVLLGEPPAETRPDPFEFDGGLGI